MIILHNVGIKFLFMSSNSTPCSIQIQENQRRVVAQGAAGAREILLEQTLEIWHSLCESRPKDRERDIFKR